VDEINNPVEEWYQAKFSGTKAWYTAYVCSRKPAFEKLLRAVRQHPCKRILDVGCAYGIFVEILNENGLESFGVDFDNLELRKFHSTLKYSAGRFFYGNLESEQLLSEIKQLNFDTVTVCHTLRYFSNPSLLAELQPERFIIQEVANTTRTRKGRKNEVDVALYSPVELVGHFPGYEIEDLYVAKFVAGFHRPGARLCRLVNMISPTYTAVLKQVVMSSHRQDHGITGVPSSASAA
jgi:SAM-dependent methyltransferase